MGGKNSYESIKRYEDKAYDKVLVRMPKGRKETIKAHAESRGESVNGFIGRAINETMERDISGTPPELPQKGLEGRGAATLPSEPPGTAERATGATEDNAGEEV